MRTSWAAGPRSAIAMTGVVACLAIPVSDSAQSATLVGTVSVSGSHNRNTISNAQIMVPALRLSLRTASIGTYRIDRLKGGPLVRIAGALGSEERQDTGTMEPKAATLLDITLERKVVELDSVISKT